MEYNIIGTSAGVVNGYPWGKLHTLTDAKDGCIGQVPVSFKTSHDIATSLKKIGKYDLSFDQFGKVVEIKEVA